DLIAGPTGDRLAGAGIMAALVSPEGRIRAANRVFRTRALGHEEGAVTGRDFARFLITDAQGVVRFEREGLSGPPVRVLQIPFLEGDRVPMLVALIDDTPPAPALDASAAATLGNLVAMMPYGTALVDREGRF